MSTKVRPTEVKALVPLLMQDWESPEDLAVALIRALDEHRASRTSYIGVMQFGPPKMEGHVWYHAIGPYPGRKSAEKALRSDPSVALATKAVVVPMLSPEGLRQRLEETDQRKKGN